MQVTWSLNAWFTMPAQGLTTLHDQNHGLLWVTGANVSMPLDSKPEQLPTQNIVGQQILYPDVTVPLAIANGSRLALHVVNRDGSLSGPVGEIVVGPAPSVVYDEIDVEMGQAQCYSPCSQDASCSWCKDCPSGYHCNGRSGVTRGPWASGGTVAVCNGSTDGSPCSGGNTHACWTTVWWEACIQTCTGGQIQCGVNCCPSTDWCGANGKCCSGCGVGCPC
jgi:hypothetical protein